MRDDLFDKLNTQNIPEEARRILRETRHYEIVGEEIHIGDFVFPLDFFHETEAFNVIEDHILSAYSELPVQLRARCNEAADELAIFMEKVRRMPTEERQRRSAQINLVTKAMKQAVDTLFAAVLIADAEVKNPKDS